MFRSIGNSLGNPWSQSKNKRSVVCVLVCVCWSHKRLNRLNCRLACTLWCA